MTEPAQAKYRAIISFRNEGKEYGRETYEVEADDVETARSRAIVRSEDSLYDDPRIPDRNRRVVSCRRIL